jgi:Flp pilus assembly protein TadG
MSLGRNRRAESERGGGVVEFALVLPVLVTLVFGIIDFGILYSNQISFRNGVREGARMGAVDNLDTACQSGDLGTFNGTAPSTRTQNLMCITKNQIGLTPKSTVRIKVVFNSTYAQYQGLIVCAITPVASKTGLFSTLLHNKFLKSKVQMTIEKTNAATLTAGEEDVSGWAGADWTWCNATSPSP